MKKIRMSSLLIIASICATPILLTTSCSKTIEHYEIGSIDGKDWKGYKSGSLERSAIVRDDCVEYRYSNYAVNYAARNLTIPDKIRINDKILPIKLGNGAFKDFDGLTGTVTLPKGMTSISDYLFEDCGNIGSVIIPHTVTSIGDFAFADCVKLFHVNIPVDIESFGKGAFLNSNLQGELEIGKNVEAIGQSAFGFCPSLTSVVISPQNTNFAIATNVTNNSRVVVKTSDQSKLKADFSNIVGSLAFGNVPTLQISGINIAERAFQGCFGIGGELTIQSGIKKIGKYAFDSTNLITGSDHVLYSDDDKWCIGYINSGGHEDKPDGDIVIHAETISICDFAFENCYDLNSVTFNEGLKNIGDTAFSDCDGLSEIIIPNSVEKIGTSSFVWIQSFDYTVKYSLSIGSGIKSIGSGAFGGNYSLGTITTHFNTNEQLNACVFVNNAFAQCGWINESDYSADPIYGGNFKNDGTLTSAVVMAYFQTNGGLPIGWTAV